MDAVHLPEYFRGIFSAFISSYVRYVPSGFRMAFRSISQPFLMALPVMTCWRLPPEGPLLGTIAVSFITSLILSGVIPSGRRPSWQVPSAPMSAPCPWSSHELVNITPSGVSSITDFGRIRPVKTAAVYAD